VRSGTTIWGLRLVARVGDHGRDYLVLGLDNVQPANQSGALPGGLGRGGPCEIELGKLPGQAGVKNVRPRAHGISSRLFGAAQSGLILVMFADLLDASCCAGAMILPASHRRTVDRKSGMVLPAPLAADGDTPHPLRAVLAEKFVLQSERGTITSMNSQQIMRDGRCPAGPLKILNSSTDG
jgi:hypothetical protein